MAEGARIDDRTADHAAAGAHAVRRSRWQAAVVCAFLAAAVLVASVPGHGAPGRVSAQSVDAPFTDEELTRGFLLTVFGSELESDHDSREARIVKKFTGPVRYRLVSTARIDWRPSVRDFMRALSDSVRHLELVEAVPGANADMTVYIVDRADYAATIRSTVWEGVDTGFLEANACSAVLAARTSGIERANIYLVGDEGFAGLSHCMVEEVAQSLGPANDSPLLPASIFNDESHINVFGLFDWFILNMLYDPRIRPGMTEEDALRVLPDVIADVRAWMPEALRDDAARHRRTDGR